ncbi:MAG: hypothetical protein LQ349_006210 [Xanthoria aureola]|nr:MAG: hypothetical protein LQ349_006210 [Xanthoria aureola]
MSGRRRPSRAAALPLRSRARVSYRELSSEVETGDDNSRSGPDQRPSRKRPRVSYNDASSGSDEEVESDEEQPRISSGQHSGIRAPRKRPSAQTNGPSKSSQSASSNKKLPLLGARRNRNREIKLPTKDVQEEDCEIPQLGGKIPPWQTLPYEILFQVFQHASHPLVSEMFEPTASMPWLVKSALLCKGFAEPALSALYYAPPLWPPSRVHRLVETLANQTEASSINYRAKVKYLDLDALKVLGFKSLGREAVQLADLVSTTPQLRGIGLHLMTDDPKYGSSVRPFARMQTKRITHHESVYSALDDHSIHLLSWIWNAHMASNPQTADEFKVIHRQKAFQTLKRLSFVNSNSSKDIEQFTISTSVLPDLKSLTLRNGVLGELGSLKSLPRNLERLAVINFLSMASTDLASFLASHGGKLTDIVLNHNNALNLAFLPQLASSCPNLERLKMDLRFYNSFVSFRDLEPHFETLLSREMVPAWPRKLQRIELFHLRKWDRAAADTFFSSLVDSAAELPDLRYIDIKASINESNWRDRISFRNKWIHRMNKVFKRISAPPDPRLKSIPVFVKHKKEFRNIRTSDASENIREVKPELKKRFSHVQVESGVSTSISSDSDTPLASRLRSKRSTDHADTQTSLQHSSRPIHRRRKPKRKRRSDDDSSTEEDSALEDLNLNDDSQRMVADDEDDGHLFIHGMCDVVRVAIDNLRPTEEHLNESNFLDEEISGDEDWVGDDDAPGGGGHHAW